MGKCAISSFIHCRRSWRQSLNQFWRCTTTSLNKCLDSQLQLQNVTNILFAIILTSKHSAVSGLHNLASNELQMENIDFKPATWKCHVWVVPTQISKPKSDCHPKSDLHTQTFPHRRVYTQTLLHTDTLTHKHSNAFTHRSFDTQTLLHTDAFTHRSFYTQTLSHTEAFTHRSFHTQRLLHTEAFTHRSFYTQTLSHTKTGPVK